jgi:lipoprotein-anchoring transpeptidase ErfK/SrfK
VVAVGQIMTRMYAGNRWRSPRVIKALVLSMALLIAPLAFASIARSQAVGYPSGSQPGFPSDRITLAPNEGDGSDNVLAERLQRTVVTLATREAPGTIIIDTNATALYYVLGQGRAIRYGVGVGREGFTWSGVQAVSRKAEWPDWYPPAEMIARQPYLPRFVAGGPGNPLGARAIYLGSSQYRIHGTNDPSTIGKFVSSGCIRLTNEDVTDLFGRIEVGTRVVVLAKSSPHLASHAAASSRHQAMNLSTINLATSSPY